jgi:cell wall-associated NlpC family hydrolase
VRLELATHSLGAARTRSRVPALLAGLIVLVGLLVLPATAASANPGSSAALVATPPKTPTTADEAKQAWIDAARRSATWGEKVLDAEQKVKGARSTAGKAAAALSKADVKVAAAQRKVDAAQRKVDAADAVVDRYQARLDAFANASFRGARLTQVSLLLTSSSPDDFLDAASALDRVAADNQATLEGAKTARQTAEDARVATERARSEADAARDEAAAAKTKADSSARSAVQARADLDTGRKQLDAEIASYQVAYARLSAGDRLSAVADMEAANISDAAQARMADQAAQRAAAGLAPDGSIDYSTAEGDAQAAREAPSVAAGIAVEAALSRQGLPYVWGATGPDSFDCSGLMLWAWQQAGITIPRTSAEQAAGLTTVPLDQLRPGDLVTFYSPVSHVGMYVGHGMVIHASMPGVPIKVVPLDAAGPDATGHRVESGD